MSRLKLAKDLALKAGKFIQGKFNSAKEITEKKNHELVSEVDVASEKIIIDAIKEHFPEDSILAEESGQEDNGGEFTWIIDPLDGTHNFLTGLPIYGVTIAIVENYPTSPKIAHGVIYLPTIDSLYWASEGEGAFRNNKRISCSSTDKIEDVRAIISSYLFQGDRTTGSIFKDVLEFRSLNCATFDFCLIAQGTYDFYLSYNNKEWDNAAGALLVREAGGKVITYEGEDWCFKNKQVIASNKLINNTILNMVDNLK